jgi:folate-dependent tRNA-U54 methylase TrmFO/GidA
MTKEGARLVLGCAFSAEAVEAKVGEASYFESCLPIEGIERGSGDTLRFSR